MIGTWRSTSGEPANPCKRRERVAHAAFQCIDLVDEQHVRHALIRKLLQQRRDGQRACGRRLAHHHGEIDHRQRATRFVGEFHGTGAVQHRPRVAEIGAMTEPDLGGRRTVARIGRPLDRLTRQPPSAPRTVSICRCCTARPAPPSGDFCRSVFLTCGRPPMSCFAHDPSEVFVTGQSRAFSSRTHRDHHRLERP